MADDIPQMIIDCIKREKKLSEWEAQFIYDIQACYKNKHCLTQKQSEKLEKIWDRIT